MVNGKGVKPTPRTITGGGVMQRVPLRWQKRLIAISYHLIIFVGAVIGFKQNIPWLIYIGVFDFLSFRKIPLVKFIQSRLITSTYCSNCQRQIDLVDCWECKCRYVSQISRHVFLPCSNCGSTFAFITCPHCDTGILI